MLNQFQSHLNKVLPKVKEHKLLLACSGGVDSMVLAHLLEVTECDFSVAHCNYKLRGVDSDLDEKLVKEWAKAHNKKVFVKTIDLSGKKGSIQLKAREGRYQWFYELVELHGFDFILTAHHLNDSLETFLFNFSRGTGLDGLTGIPERNDMAIRPLLTFSKGEILSYARENQLKWREDSSNVESKYQRNKIRNEIVPLFGELTPTFLSNYKNTKAHLQGASLLLQDYKELLQEKLFQRKGTLIEINLAQLNELHPIQRYLYFILHEFGFTQWEDIAQLLTAQSGKEVLSNTHRLIKDREVLILTQRKDSEQETHYLLKGEKNLISPIELRLDDVDSIGETDSNTVYLDKEKLNYPLKLRKWENADYFYPLGMKGSKKLSKFFKDEKLNTLEKESQWLLCSGQDVVWVIGRRADNRFKVTDATQQILKIEFLS